MLTNLSNRCFKAIDEARYILIITHISPDADTISSALAFSNYMIENKIKHKVYNVDTTTIPRGLNFLPNFDKITSILPKFYDLIIYMDSTDQRRAGFKADGIKTINIDHHKSNTNFGDINIVDPQKASTAELVYDIFEAANIDISKNSATCIYSGMYDDSIAFTTPRVDSRTFEIVNKLLEKKISPSHITDKLYKRESLAKYRMMPKILDTLSLHLEGKVATVYMRQKWLDETGASVNECDDVVDMVLNIAIVQIIAYVRIVNGKVRVSLRSKGDIDVSQIASRFDGGGHKNAAGLSMDTTNIDEGIKNIIDSIKLNFR